MIVRIGALRFLCPPVGRPGAPVALSVAIQDVTPERWVEDVYKPDILGKADEVYKKPGYDPLR
jgi:4-oxalocrotonate tautomerase